MRPLTFKQLINKALFTEILKGMALTFKMMLSKPVTIQYPDEKRRIFPGFRGKHAFVRDPKTGRQKCIMCMKCVNICPSQCISLGKGRDENNKPFLEHYNIDALRCIYCGYCVEVCPVCALVLTEEYEYGSYVKSDIFFDKHKMLQNWDDFAAKLSGDVYWNKFWRPSGVDISKMPKAKREQAPVPLRPSDESPSDAPSSEQPSKPEAKAPGSPAAGEKPEQKKEVV